MFHRSAWAAIWCFLIVLTTGIASPAAEQPTIVQVCLGMRINAIPNEADEVIGRDDVAGWVVTRYGKKPWLIIISDPERQTVVACHGPSLTLPGGQTLEPGEDISSVFAKLVAAPVRMGAIIPGTQWYAFEVGGDFIKVDARDGHVVGYSLISRLYWNTVVLPTLLEFQI